MMTEILRTTDLVLVSYVDALLTAAGICVFVLDANMSVLEGSIGILPRRMMVDAEDANQARRVMLEAGLGQWLTNDAPG